MNSCYVTVPDIIDLKGKMSVEEQEHAEKLIPVVISLLKNEGARYGKNLDMLAFDSDYRNVLKSVVADIVYREIQESKPQDISTMGLSQFSQSALGYTVSGTIANAGGGLFIKRSELDRLGFRRQKIGTLDIWGVDRKCHF